MTDFAAQLRERGEGDIADGYEDKTERGHLDIRAAEELERLQKLNAKQDELLQRAEILLNPGREHRMGMDPNCQICKWLDDVGALTIVESP